MHDINRWESERNFFDHETYSTDPLPDIVLQRYSQCRSPWLPAEFPLKLVQPLAGKYVFEMGCGDGEKSVLMAALGARVVGVDISPKAIEAARERACRQGVNDRTEFLAGPLEEFEFTGRDRFDCVIGFSILHHIIPSLAEAMKKIKSLAKPDAAIVFSEPYAPSQLLRKFRLMLPIESHATPDERPLEPREFAVLKQHLPGLQVRYFDATLRVASRLFTRGWYEKLSPARRAAYNFSARFDDLCLNKLHFTTLASAAVFYRLPQ